MKADSAILQRLDAPTLAPCWPVGAEGKFFLYNIYYFISSLTYYSIFVEARAIEPQKDHEPHIRISPFYRLSYPKS